MLHLAAHEFARAEIHNVTGAEHRLLIAGSERVETPESGDKLGCKASENVRKASMSNCGFSCEGRILDDTYSSNRRVNSGIFSSLSESPTA